MTILLFLIDIPHTSTQTCTKQSIFTDEETNQHTVNI